MKRGLAAALTMVAAAWALALGATGSATAQGILDPILNPPTTQPGTPESPTTTWGLFPTPETTPPPTEAPPPPPSEETSGSVAAEGEAPAFGGGDGEGVAPPVEAGPFPSDLAALMNSVKRSGSNNNRALLDGMRALTDLGVPLDEAMRVGMGSFPVAGYASWSHDWWYPRFGPGWRLHQGTDVFADRGTPLRSPIAGSIRMSNSGLGGRSTYVVQHDGTYFYMAHLDSWPDGLHDGQTVAVGDIVGYVGTSGNAAGGSAHLHIEVHPAVKVVTVGKGKKQTTKVVHSPVPPGTVLPAADPKAVLDAYLQDAVDNMPAVVAAYQANMPAPAAAPAALGASTDPALIGPSLALASRKGLLLSGAQPALSVPLVGFAFLLLLMIGCLTPVLGTRVRFSSLSVGGGAGTVPAGGSAAGHGGRRRRRRPTSAPLPVVEPRRARVPLDERRRRAAASAGGDAASAIAVVPDPPSPPDPPVTPLVPAAAVAVPDGRRRRRRGQAAAETGT